MVEVGIYSWSLFIRSFGILWSWGGWAVAPIAVSALPTLWELAQRIRKARADGKLAFGELWRSVLETVRTKSTAFTIVAWSVIFVVAFLVAVHEDHSKLTLENASITSTLASEADVRPYLLIEDLSPSQVLSVGLSDPRNKIRPAQAYSRGYVFGTTKDREFLLFNTREVGGKTTARNVEYHQRVTVVDPEGVEVDVGLDPAFTGSEVLLPGQSTLRQITFRARTAYTGEARPMGRVRVRLVVTYSGKQSDPSMYFYKTVFIINRQTNTHLEPEFGGVAVESTDEGVVKDFGQLLK